MSEFGQTARVALTDAVPIERAVGVRAGAAATPTQLGEIGYVVMGFPRISETFITQEIHVLERLGLRLRVYAVKRGDEDKVHELVKQIRAPLSYLPQVSSLSGTGLVPWLLRNLPAYAAAHAVVLKQRPLAYLRTLASALCMSVRYRKHALARLRKVFIKEFLQAGHIAMQIMTQPGVRHLHGHFCHGATTITWFVSRLTGLPFSFTAHAKDIYQEDQNPGDLLQRKLRAARFATTCTGANAEHIQRCHGQHIHTVYHGLDTKFFAPALNRAQLLAAERAPLLLADNECEDGTPLILGANECEDGTPLILGVGRFVEKKGFRYLIEALGLLRQQGVAFQCLLVGESGDQQAIIAQRVAELGLQQTVQLREPVTHDELRALYARASVFVLPCLVAADGDRDGIPNVLAEAMAMGLAVVSTATSGIPELVRDGIDGVFVPQRDAAALAGALQQLLTDAALRQRLGTAARARVCEVFDTERTTQQLKQLFVQALRHAPKKAVA